MNAKIKYTNENTNILMGTNIRIATNTTTKKQRKSIALFPEKISPHGQICQYQNRITIIVGYKMNQVPVIIGNVGVRLYNNQIPVIINHTQTTHYLSP